MAYGQNYSKDLDRAIPLLVEEMNASGVGVASARTTG
jgi:hypothetical protein